MLVPFVLKSSKISVGHCLNVRGIGTGPSWERTQTTKRRKQHHRRNEVQKGDVSRLLSVAEEDENNVQGTDLLVSEVEEMALRCPPGAAKNGKTDGWKLVASSMGHVSVNRPHVPYTAKL